MDTTMYPTVEPSGWLIPPHDQLGTEDPDIAYLVYDRFSGQVVAVTRHRDFAYRVAKLLGEYRIDIWDVEDCVLIESETNYNEVSS